MFLPVNWVRLRRRCVHLPDLLKLYFILRVHTWTVRVVQLKSLNFLWEKELPAKLLRIVWVIMIKITHMRAPYTLLRSSIIIFVENLMRLIPLDRPGEKYTVYLMFYCESVRNANKTHRRWHRSPSVLACATRVIITVMEWPRSAHTRLMRITYFATMNIE